MTTHMDTAAIAEAKQNDRDGGPREDRPEAVDDFLEPEEAVGFEQGLPLLGKGYESYPENVLSPSAGDDVEAVASHDMVASVEDLAAELNAPEERVSTALTLHGIEDIEGGSGEARAVEQPGVIEVPLHGAVAVEHLRSPIYEDARLLEHLYMRCGLGVSEIKTVLEDGMNAGRDSSQPRWRVREANIRAALKDASLIEEDDPKGIDSENTKDLRLGGTTVKNLDNEERSSSGGLVVSASDYGE